MPTRKSKPAQAAHFPGDNLHEVCLCGHTRAWHYNTFAQCLKCAQSPGDAFKCEPGTCDRFTWTPN